MKYKLASSRSIRVRASTFYIDYVLKDPGINIKKQERMGQALVLRHDKKG